ncbi:MAG TPA: hypothetical protein VME18_01350 [Acidobacteriaceae bacterium]|nr:hypothetical protein [Acidobacteriaceae bacterium]
MAEELHPAGPGKTRVPRSALLAVGIAVAAALVWWALHRSREALWNDQAITARFVELSVARGQTDVHLVLRYELTNRTGQKYRMQKPTYGELMRRTPDGSMKEVDSVEWDQGTPVPPHGTAVEQLDVAMDPLQYDIDLDELKNHDKLVDFEKRRLQEMRGLVFLDYMRRYRIELPRGWQ